MSTHYKPFTSYWHQKGDDMLVGFTGTSRNSGQSADVYGLQCLVVQFLTTHWT